jgi:hypothetical protein
MRLLLLSRDTHTISGFTTISVPETTQTPATFEDDHAVKCLGRSKPSFSLPLASSPILKSSPLKARLVGVTRARR